MGLFDFFKKKTVEDDYGRAMVEQEVMQKAIQNVTPGEYVMVVEDVFSIAGRGTVVTGKIVSGSVSLYENLMIVESGKITQVKGIEMFRKQLDYAQVGDNVGLLLGDITRDEVVSGNRLAKL